MATAVTDTGEWQRPVTRLVALHHVPSVVAVVAVEDVYAAGRGERG
jgi:hypothetical protein